MATPFIGFARGDAAGRSPNPFIAAELVFHMSKLVEAMGLLSSDLVPQAVETAARQSISEICHGVSEETKGQFEVRTSVLDPVTTCRRCRELNGLVVRKGTPEHAEYKPPRHCLGKGNCKCTYDPAPVGESGLRMAGSILEVTRERVLGEIHLERNRAPVLGTARLERIAQIRRRMYQEHESELLFAERQADAINKQRLIREALTNGKPIFARNILASLEFLANTGTVPALSAVSSRSLVNL